MEVHRSDIWQISNVRIITLPFTDNRGGTGVLANGQPLSPLDLPLVSSMGHCTVIFAFARYVVTVPRRPWQSDGARTRVGGPGPGPRSMPAI